MRHYVLLGIILLGLTSSPGIAQIVDGRQIVNVDLIGGRSQSNEPLIVGVRFRIEPGWYLYWKNPGDAGLPIQIKWNVPHGWTAGPTKIPVPSKFIHGDIISYGYKDSVVLFSDMIPAESDSGEIRASIDWLVCKESCVRGSATAFFDVRHTATPEELQLLKNSKLRLPEGIHNLNLIAGSAELKKLDHRWICNLSIQGDDAGNITDFFPEENGEISIDYSSIRVSEGRLVFTLTRANDELMKTVLNGLLVTRSKGYQFSFPINFSSF